MVNMSAVACAAVLALAVAQNAFAMGAKPPSTPVTVTPPRASPSPGSGGAQIEAIAAASSCSRYGWRNRGRAPAGYVKGVALAFARSLCRLTDPGELRAPAAVMSQASVGDAYSDALAHYSATFASHGMEIDVAGAGALRAVYALGLGLGMRESSGTYCAGNDTTAGPETASEAEAGPFQTSYNSMGIAPELRALYVEYQAHPQRCALSVFKEGASCPAQAIVGSGAGAAYQRFNKSCPAFATEYAMVVLRDLRRHFGPINRHEAEVVPACAAMFQQVQGFVAQDPSSICAGLE